MINEGEFERMMNNDQELDPKIEEHFVIPLGYLREVTETLYPLSKPPDNFSEARRFASHLWECSDKSDLQTLAESFPEGAAKLLFLLSLLAFERLAKQSGRNLVVEPTEGKPFAVLAFVALEWLDEVEAENPGKTQWQNQQGR